MELESNALIYLSELEMMGLNEKDKDVLIQFYDKMYLNYQNKQFEKEKEFEMENGQLEDDLQYLKKEYDEVVGKYNALQQMHLKPSTSIDDLEEFNSNLQSTVESLEVALQKERKHTQTCVDTYESEIANLKSHLQEMETIQEQLQDEKRMLQKEKSQIKLLHREDSGLDVMEELQNEIYLLQQKNTSYKNNVKTLKSDLVVAIEERDELDKLVDQLELENEYLTSIKHEYEGQKERIQSMKDSFEMNKYESTIRQRKTPSTMDLRNGLSSLFDELRASAGPHIGSNTAPIDDDSPVSVFILGLEAIVEFFFGCFRFIYLIMTAFLYAVIGPTTSTTTSTSHHGSPYIEEVEEFDSVLSPLNSIGHRTSMSSMHSRYSFK